MTIPRTNAAEHARLWLREARSTINADRVRLLVEAARSGTYWQGRQYLCEVQHVPSLDAGGTRSRMCFCILGLATEVARLNGVDIAWEDLDDHRAATCPGWSGGQFTAGVETYSTTELLPCVYEWYGFDSELPSALTPAGEVWELAELNDDPDRPWTLEQLGDVIAFTYLGELSELYAGSVAAAYDKVRL